MLRTALALWRGAAYADVADAGFTRATRDRVEELRLAAQEELLTLRLDRGEHDQLIGELAELVSMHPLRERLRGVQLLALYRAGQQAAALKAYAELREQLAEELGVDPGPELTALHQAILTHDAALAAPPSVNPTRTNLPTPLNELIGREQTLKQAAELLGSTRLVTLVGPGGVGKTRLALEAARDHPGQVWLVELAAVQADDVLDAVAAAVGLRDDTAARPMHSQPSGHADRLAEALATRQALLLLDNCEHVIEPVAALVRRLLERAPSLNVLATSRESLGLAGEQLLEVQPLDPPAAAELFLPRAAAAAPAFEDDAEAVAAICRRLDGIPLALELAATRVRGLGLPELARRLDDRFRLLAGGLAKQLDWLTEVGGTSGIAFILAQLGFIAEQRGDYAAAEQLHQQGYAAAKSTADERAIALALEGLAGAAIGRGDVGTAVRLLTEATALRQAVGTPLPPGERFDVDRIEAAISRARRRPSSGSR